MANCVRCGKGLFLAPKVKLKDSVICKYCYLSLGFSPESAAYAKDYYNYDLIKNGKAAYDEHCRKLNESFKANNPGLVDVINSFESDDEEAEPNVNVSVEYNINVETPLKMANYGQKREVNATDGEIELYDLLCKMFPEEKIELCRKSNDYVTAMLGEWDVIRFKYSDRAKWIAFPVLEKPQKHYIDNPQNIADYEANIRKSIEFIKKA